MNQPKAAVRRRSRGKSRSSAAPRERRVPELASAPDTTPAALDLEGAIVLVTMLANQISASGSLTFQTRHGLTSAEWKTMAIVAAMPESSGSDIAQVLSIDKAAVSRTVRALADRGLLTVERTTARANLQSITLSIRGDELHREALATAVEREQCLLDGIEPGERAQLHDLLRRMIRQMPEVFRLADPTAEGFAAKQALPLVSVPAPAPAVSSVTVHDGKTELQDRIDRLESLLADIMLENASLRNRRAKTRR